MQPRISADNSSSLEALFLMKSFPSDNSEKKCHSQQSASVIAQIFEAPFFCTSAFIANSSQVMNEQDHISS